MAKYGRATIFASTPPPKKKSKREILVASKQGQGREREGEEE